MNNLLFSETQKFKQWWIWLLLIGINGTILYGIIQQLFLGQQFGNQPMSDIGLIITGVFMLLLSLLFFLFRLETHIKNDGIYVRFFTLHKSFRFYSWDTISIFHVRQYSPISEYGGWGIHGFGKNRAFNVSGNKGLQIEFKNGEKLLIGTDNFEELKRTILKIQASK